MRLTLTNVSISFLIIHIRDKNLTLKDCSLFVNLFVAFRFFRGFSFRKPDYKFVHLQTQSSKQPCKLVCH